MKRTCLLLLLAAMSLLLTACGADGLYRVTLITDGAHRLTGDCTGDMLMLGGQATLSSDATLHGSAHVLAGQLEVQGWVQGDVTLLGGRLTLGPTARVGGNLNLGSGTYHSSPGAIIEGRTHAGSGIALPDLPERGSQPLGGKLLRNLVSAALLGLAAALLARMFPRGVARVGEAAVRHALVSGAVGLLVGVVGLSLLVTMAYTILLIPVSVLGLFVLGLAIAFGWIGLGVTAGRLTGQALKRPLSPAKSAFLGTLACVFALEWLSSIPFIGGLFGIVVAAVGLGAVALTRFGWQRFVPASDADLSI